MKPATALEKIKIFVNRKRVYSDPRATGCFKNCASFRHLILSENLLARAFTQEGLTMWLAILQEPPDIPSLQCLFQPPYICACPGTRYLQPCLSEYSQFRFGLKYVY